MGKKITFLADSGATLSLIRAEELPQCKKSGRYIHSIGAAGTKKREPLTIPLTCIDYGDETCTSQKQIKHSFVLSEVCPMNLLGRDLLLALGMNLISTPDGLIVARSLSSSALAQIPKPLLHVYQWLLPLEASEELIAAANDKVPGDAHFMKAPNLHCTARATRERNSVFESQFFFKRE